LSLQVVRRTLPSGEAVVAGNQLIPYLIGGTAFRLLRHPEKVEHQENGHAGALT
jgi:hypothetical protein